VGASTSRTTRSERHEAARLKAVELKQRQQRRESRNRLITLVSVVVGLAVVAALVVVIVKQGTRPPAVTAAGPVTATAAAGGIPFGAGGTAGTVNDGAVNVTVYVDYMCPNCGHFETVNSANLDALRESGDITLVVHPVAILDSGSQGTRYSTRAAAAFAYVADKDPAHALGFSARLFADQPAEGSTGLTDERLAELARAAGVADDVATSAVGGAFADWVTESTDVAVQTEALQGARGFGTPTILLDGTRYDGDWSDADAFKADIEALVER